MYQALGQAAFEFRLSLSTRAFLSAHYVPVRRWDSAVSKTDVIPSFLEESQGGAEAAQLSALRSGY